MAHIQEHHVLATSLSILHLGLKELTAETGPLLPLLPLLLPLARPSGRHPLQVRLLDVITDDVIGAMAAAQLVDGSDAGASLLPGGAPEAAADGRAPPLMAADSRHAVDDAAPAALHLAAAHDRAADVRLLLSNGADPNALVENQGVRSTALHWAAASGSVNAISALLEASPPASVDCFDSQVRALPT